MGRSQRHMVLEQGNDATGASHVQGVIAPGLLQQLSTPPAPPIQGRMANVAVSLDDVPVVEVPTGPAGGPLEGSTLTGAIPADLTPVDPNPPAMQLISISPADAPVGGPDIVMHAYGANFTETSVILFNGGEEPTTFVSATELTTGVKPSTASGPISVPVTIKDGDVVSAPVSFTFTEPFIPEEEAP